MKTLVKMMFGTMVIEFPTIRERIEIFETLIANDIMIWTPAVEFVMLDCCKEVRMTPKEIEWFTKL